MLDELTKRERLESGFYVGGFLAEPLLQRIHKGEETIQVEPKVMEVLLCMAERAGQPVSKAEFMEEVWTDTVVTDDALLRCISELRKVFDDNPREPAYIETIRKRGYRLIAPVSQASPLDAAEGDGAADASAAAVVVDGSGRSASRAHGRSVWLMVGAAVGVVFVGVLWVGRFFPGDFAVPLRAVPLTTYPGEEADPNLSPDGDRVAVVWDGGDGGSFDIYVKDIESASPRRLTDSPADDLGPAWSPDGSQVAFLRVTDASSGVYVTPAVGGAERLVADLGAREAHSLSWSPDGATLAFTAQREVGEPFAVWLLSLETLELQMLTDPPADYRGDRELAFSPDGQSIAFSRSVLEKVDDLFVLSLAGGIERRVTFDHAEITGLDWMPDGRQIVFTSDREGIPNLWRVSAAGGAPVWIPTTGEGHGVHQPSSARVGGRMTFVESHREVNVWDVPVGGRQAPVAPVIASTRWDSNPDVSPDGSRLAFVSNRSGDYEIWTSAADGGKPAPLTSLRGPFTETPRWSPDGRRLAFVAKEEGSSDIYVVDADGGVPVRMTTAASNDKAPAWSSDGRWIYFASNRTGTWETWRISASGGERMQVTTGGGFAAADGFHGEGLYFTKREAAGLWLLPSDGGPERQVLSDLQPYDWGNWSVASDGVYFIRRGVGVTQLVRHDPETGLEEVVAVVDRVPKHPSLATSPDGSRIVLSRVDRSDSDILLVDEDR